MSALPSIDALGAMGALAPQQAKGVFPDDLVAPPATTGAGVAASPFADLVSQGLAQVNDKLRAGEAGLQRLATGDMTNLHQTMIQLEESRLSLQLLMQVRSRLLEAYQDVMKMQV